MKKLRRKRASAIVFSVVLALVLVIIGVGFLFISLYMGAQSETKNAVDAGALNVGKQTLDDKLVSVFLTTDDKQTFFRDVTDNLSGKVTLRNIDRVWAKALFVAINKDGADQDGNNSGSDSSGSVQSALEGAQEISDALQAKLVDENNLHEYFTEFAKQNSVRMIGTNAEVDFLPGANWQTSLMDREKESNIEVTDNLPLNYPSRDSIDYMTKCTRTPMPSGAKDKYFLKGYFPIAVANQTFWQVPFLYDQKPHLVARSMFDSDKQPPNMSGWDKAVPNAFSVEGKASKPGAVAEKATSWVQTNPRQTFPLHFPHGFIRVVLQKNDLHWQVFGLPVGDDTYEFMPTEKSSLPIPLPLICAEATGDAHVGNEYLPPVLYIAICGNSPPQEGDTMKYLLQRCQEMVPDCTMNDLRFALTACPISTADQEQTFFIYPGLGPIKIVATPDSATAFPPGIGLDKNADPEGKGNEQTLDATSGIPSPVPNFGLETYVCDGVTAPDLPVLYTGLTIERKWAPGTGYQGGCLGELTIHHTTDVQIMVYPCSCPV